MATNDIEIEIKIRVEEDDFFELKERLNKTAKFVKKSAQKDEYFTPAHRNFVEPKFPFEWFSIRERGDKLILNYKHFYPENAEVCTHSDEFETEIKDLGRFKKILNATDFKKLTIIEKEREIYTYKDKFEIALDKVKELGYSKENRPPPVTDWWDARLSGSGRFSWSPKNFPLVEL